MLTMTLLLVLKFASHILRSKFNVLLNLSKHKVFLVCSKLKAEMSSMQPELAARGSTAVQSIEIAVTSLMTSSFCFY